MRRPRTWHVGRRDEGRSPLVHVEADDEAGALAAALEVLTREQLVCLAGSLEREPERWTATPCARSCAWHVARGGRRVVEALVALVVVALALVVARGDAAEGSGRRGWHLPAAASTREVDAMGTVDGDEHDDKARAEEPDGSATAPRGRFAVELDDAIALLDDEGPLALLERLRAVGVALGVFCRRAGVVEVGALATVAVDAPRSALARLFAGDKAAIAELRRLNATQSVSSYRGIEQLCEEWLAAPPVLGSGPWFELRTRLVRMGVYLGDDGYCQAFDGARNARDLAVRLIVATNAIDPRRTGESAERHEKRVRQALADAASRASPARRKARRKT